MSKESPHSFSHQEIQDRAVFAARQSLEIGIHPSLRQFPPSSYLRERAIDDAIAAPGALDMAIRIFEQSEQRSKTPK